MDRRPSITSVPGIKVGHAGDEKALTGCTVILTENGAVAGIDVRGGAPGTRETDLLQPVRLVERVHALLLTGGSAFGLDAAGGVMDYLEKQGRGFDTGIAKVPIVPAAVLFDLGVGDASVRPDRAMGWQACQNASQAPVAEGNVGVGLGATVGKVLGLAYAMKGGLGSWAEVLPNGVTVGALVAVNCLGDVWRPHGGIVAGARDHTTGQFLDTMKVIKEGGAATSSIGGNTTLAVVATDAALTKEGANLVARMAHSGLARTIIPIHTLLDGDTVFALSTGAKEGDVLAIGALASEVLGQAVVRAVEAATELAGIPAAGDCRKNQSQ
jgi:L-aminopeptidase/D-esterase-like protein